MAQPARAKPRDVVLGRKDPRPRHLEGWAPWNTLVNKDSKRRYVLAFRADEQTGEQYYEALGYEVEVAREGGVRLAGGKTCRNGEPIEWRGHVLMSIDKKDAERIDLYGPDGNNGSARMDEIEDQIIDRKNVIFDPLRGQHGNFRQNQYYRAINETGVAEEHVGEL